MFWNNWNKNRNVPEIRKMAREKYLSQKELTNKGIENAKKDAEKISSEIIKEIKERLSSDEESVVYRKGAYRFYVVYQSDNAAFASELFQKEIQKHIKRQLKNEGVSVKKTKVSKNDATRISLGCGCFYLYIGEVKITVSV